MRHSLVKWLWLTTFHVTGVGVDMNSLSNGSECENMKIYKTYSSSSFGWKLQGPTLDALKWMTHALRIELWLRLLFVLNPLFSSVHYTYSLLVSEIFSPCPYSVSMFLLSTSDQVYWQLLMLLVFYIWIETCSFSPYLCSGLLCRKTKSVKGKTAKTWIFYTQHT